MRENTVWSPNAQAQRPSTRNDKTGIQQGTPADYASEIAAAQRERPNTRFVVYDHDIATDRAWYRLTLMWNDVSTGLKRTRAGMPAYRIEGNSSPGLNQDR